MSEYDPIPVAGLIGPSDEPPEPDYEEWVVKRIEASIADDRANPHLRKSGAEVRRMLEERMKVFEAVEDGA